MKTDEGEENNPQRNPKENYIGQNRGKEEINLVAQKPGTNKKKTTSSVKVPIKSKMTKKKAPPDQAPIEPNKGSALPSKGKTRERPGAKSNRSTN